MKLTCKNFKRYEHKEFVFRKSEIVHLDGDSGCGKSTLFAAISWVLYGKEPEPYPRLAPKKQTWVELSYDKTAIYRQRNPKKLIVLISGKKYESDVAQKYINDLWGVEQVWNSTSYIRQKRKHFLLELPVAQRTSLLNQMIFRKYDPALFDEECSKRISSEKRSLDLANSNETRQRISYENIVSLFDQDKNWRDYVEINTESHKILKKYDNELKIENDLFDITNKKERKLELLQNQKNNLGEIPEVDNDLLLKLEKDHVLYKSWYSYYQKNQEYEKETDKLQEKIRSLKDIEYYKTYTDELYRNTLIKEQLFKKYKNICFKYNLEYSKEDVYEHILQSKLVLEKHKKYEQNLKYISEKKKFEQKISGLNIGDKKIVESELAKLRKLQDCLNKEKSDKLWDGEYIKQKELIDLNNNESKQKRNSISKNIEDLKLNKENLVKIKTKQDSLKQIAEQVLQCPSCSASLHYNDGDLNLYIKENIFENVELEIEELNNKIDEISSIVKKQKDCDNKKYNNNLNKIEQEKYDKETKIKVNLYNCERKIDLLTQELKIITQLLEKRNKYKRELDVVTLQIDDDIIFDTNIDIKKIKTKINSLSQIEFITLLDFDSTKIYQKLQEKNLLKELNKKSNKLIAPEKPLKEVIEFKESSEYKAKKIKYEKMYRFNQEKELKEKELKEINKSISNIKIERSSLNIKTSILKLKEDIKKISKDIELSKISKKINNSYDELKKYELEYKNSSEKLQTLKHLKNVSFKIQNDTLKGFVVSVNKFLSIAVPQIFDFPIKISLSTFKTLKSKTKKSGIYLDIICEGVKVDNISGVSGGEETRISTLLAIAFNRAFDSKLFILDEAASDLDCDKKDELLKLVKTYLPDRIVIMTCHESCQGYYDRTITIKR